MFGLAISLTTLFANWVPNSWSATSTTELWSNFIIVQNASAETTLDLHVAAYAMSVSSKVEGDAEQNPPAWDPMVATLGTTQQVTNFPAETVQLGPRTWAGLEVKIKVESAAQSFKETTTQQILRRSATLKSYLSKEWIHHSTTPPPNGWGIVIGGG
jgi:hypothetical protein